VVAAPEYGLQVVQGRVVLVPYDPAWVTAFEVEREVLQAALQPWLRGGVEHIGSTSIPGLAAKPIIDMLAGVADFRKASAAEGALRDLGYTRAEHRPHEALHFFRPHGRSSSGGRGPTTSTSPRPPAPCGGSGSPFVMRCATTGTCFSSTRI